MEVNQVLSKEMHVPPLKEGEKAVFRLLNAFTKEKGREEPTCPEVHLMSDKEMVWDPFQGKMIMIGNVTGVRAVREPGGGIKHNEAGAVMMIPETSKVEFIKGYKTCSHEESGTYQYLMRSKKCVDNRWRPRKGGTKKVGMFELVTDKKTVSTAMQMEDIQYHAQRLVREKEWVDLKAIKAKLNESPDPDIHIKSADNDLQGMKLELIKLTKTHPKKVVWASDDVKSKMRVTIYESMNFGIVTFDNGVWGIQEKGKYRMMHTATPDKDAIDSLIEHFESKKGYDDYIKMNKELEFIFKATNK